MLILVDGNGDKVDWSEMRAMPMAEIGERVYGNDAAMRGLQAMNAELYRLRRLAGEPATIAERYKAATGKDHPNVNVQPLTL
jgi:hypothetical protein